MTAKKAEVNLKVTLGPLSLPNPVMVASGTFGYGLEYSSLINISKLGGIVVKGLSIEPRPGNPPPRLVETHGGLINAIGLENVGVDNFVNQKLPLLLKHEVPVIVNIFGNTVEEYSELAKILDGVTGISALEINISCPNVKSGGIVFGTDPKQIQKVVSSVRENTGLPLITKLTPNVTDIGEMAKAAVEAGTDIISAINTVSAMAVDINSRKPKLGNIVGGLSGPAIKPIALKKVWNILNSVEVPVIGIGGISNHEDALEFLLVGARAVQIGTANFIHPKTSVEIIEGIRSFLESNGLKDVNEFIGSLKLDS
ncbi:MAG: dihydroorotate dehydrogenase [Deltaproteobacteria bacterium]|nr:MAG: dihydroorotate dehydrogenase [Deltaproteobacteria bacterium]